MLFSKEILVAYDIENNKARNKVFNGLKDIGLFSIQKSVFIGSVKPAEERAVQMLLMQYIDKKTDKAFVLSGSFFEQLKKTGIGYTIDDFFFYENSCVI